MVISRGSLDPHHPSCGCPNDEGLIRHQRETCTDPVVAKLGWYFDPPETKKSQYHGVALAILVDGLDSPRLRIQCECGWHDSCGEVITLDAVVRSVSTHLEAIR